MRNITIEISNGNITMEANNYKGGTQCTTDLNILSTILNLTSKYTERKIEPQVATRNTKQMAGLK